MLGRLSLSALPLDVPIVVGTFIGVCIIGIAVLGLITYYGKWGYLWKEWFTTVDHKRLAVMYIVLALVALARGFADAIMMRTQLALAYAGEPRLPAAASLRPDLFRPWHDHDLLPGHGVHDRSVQLHCAAADRRT
jgi:hypothetical protein